MPRWEITSLNKSAPLLLEHQGAFIHAGAFSADGKLAVIGGNDAALLVCDSTTGKWLRSLEGHSGQITFLSTYEIDGMQYALSQAQDCTIRKWDLETGLCLQTLKHPEYVPRFEVTPDRKRVVSVSGNRLMVWDLASGSCLQTIETKHPSPISGVKILPDGSSAISYSVEGERSLVKEWNLNTALCLRTFEIPGRVLGGHLSVTTDGRRFIDFDWKGAHEVTLPGYWDLPFTGEHDHTATTSA